MAFYPFAFLFFTGGPFDLAERKSRFLCRECESAAAALTMMLLERICARALRHACLRSTRAHTRATSSAGNFQSFLPVASNREKVSRNFEKN
jgi:hypothetical protein